MDRPQPSKLESDDEEFAAASPSRDWGDDWVHELIEISRPGVNFRRPSRLAWERQVPFEYHDFS